MARDNKGFTPILKAAEHPLLCMLEFLLESTKIDPVEKIDALELAGAEQILHGNKEDCEIGFGYWWKAILLREKEQENPINKVRLQTGRVVQWVTLEEINKIIRDPAVFWIKAMVTRLRIYAERSVEAVDCFLQELTLPGRAGLFSFIDGRHYYLLNPIMEPKITHIMDLALEALGARLRLVPKYDDSFEWIKCKLIEQLANKLPCCQQTTYFSILGNDQPLPCRRIKTLFQLILAGDPDGRSDSQYNYKFFEMLAGLPDLLLQGEIVKYLSKLLRQGNGMELAEACTKKDWKTLLVLLHLQTDPNATTTESGGNGPLDVVADQMTLGNDEPLSNTHCEMIKTSLQLMSSDPRRYGFFSYEFYAILAGIPGMLQEKVRQYLSKLVGRNEGKLLVVACTKKDWKTLSLLLHLHEVDSIATATGSGGNRTFHVVSDQMVPGNDELLSNAKCEMLKTSLQLISAFDPKGYIDLYHNYFTYKFFRMLAGVQGLLLQETVRLYLSISVRRNEGWLEEACTKKDWKTLRFLLNLQADPNKTTKTSGGNGALHLVADQQVSLEFTPGHLLYDYGAQPFRKNDQGKTAVDIWIEKNCDGKGKRSPKWNHRPSWCRNTVPKLSCLSAKTININGINYSRLPNSLLNFVALH